MSDLIIPEEHKLSEELEAKAIEIVSNNSVTRIGSYFRVWVGDDLVVKVNHLGNHFDRLQKELMIGRHLKQEGLNVPEMYGLSSGAPYCSVGPFLALEKLSITEYDSLKSKRDRAALVEGCEKQLWMARELGYLPLDTRRELNCGIDLNTRKVYLFDFESWMTEEDRK